MAMPLRLIYNVQISPKQKLGLVAVFGLGFVMIAFSIVRAKQVLVDQLFVNLTLLMLWSTLAGTVSLIVGSLPALKLLIARRKGGSRYGTAGSSNIGSIGKPTPYGMGSRNGVSMGGVPAQTRQNSVPLEPVSAASEKGSGRTFSPVSSVSSAGFGRKQQQGVRRKGDDPWDSQEEMLSESEGQFIQVKHDVVSLHGVL
jgi:hypothetical protein